MYNFFGTCDWPVFSSDEEKEEIRKKWLSIATLGAEFLRKHGRDENGYFYFSLNRAGEPLIAPYSIFSDCFAGNIPIYVTDPKQWRLLNITKYVRKNHV
jgi:mannose/cellobiose epimerase-like protein (N-acyl-D-glucosamine 2-epimerase family)